MNLIKLSNYLLDKKTILLSILLVPLLILSTFLEVLGVSLVPVLIGLIIEPSKILESGINVDFRIISDFSIYLSSLEEKKLIILFSLIFFTTFLFKNIILVSIIYFENFISYKMKTYLRIKLASKYFFAPYEFHINENSSSIISNLVHEVKISAEYFKTIIIAIREFLVILSILFALLLIYFDITVISLTYFIVISSALYFFLKNYLYKKNKTAFYLRRKFLNLAKQGLGSIKSTLILQREKQIFKEISNMVEKMEIIELKIIFFSRLPRIYFEILCISTICLIIFFVATFDEFFINILPILATLGIALVRLLPSFNVLLSSMVNLKSFKISALCISNEIIKLNKHNKLKKNYNNLSSTNYKGDFLYGDIKFKNVSYCYPNTNKFIFKDLNLELKKGQIIGIIGKSGSGKTTLVDLILGLLKPTFGSITSNKININENIKAWRENLGYVPQDIYLIDDSVAKNILLGLTKSKINKKNFINSIKQSGVKSFINNMKNQLNYNVGEMGVKVSGGQKQRIGIARALYKNPKIIVFDEATSSLDKENESQIIKDIKKISKNKTIILITHRLENLRFANRILEVKKNKVNIIK